MTMAARILVTGASGCVGRYLVEELLAGHRVNLCLIVRDVSSLPVQVSADPRVELVCGDLRDPQIQSAATEKEVDAAILVAADWGPDSQAVNVDANLAIAGRLRSCSHLIHVGSASVLDRDNGALSEAGSLGTPYISSKASCSGALRQGASGLPVTIVHPTLIAGGGERGIRCSHFTTLLRTLVRHKRALSFVHGVGAFHAIHALDLARIISGLLCRQPPEGVREIVAGGPVTTIDSAIDVFCELTQQKRRRLANVRLMEAFAARVYGVRLTPWDRFCMTRRDMSHVVTTMPEDFGVSSAYPDFRSIVEYSMGALC
ncbi:MAG: NAD-dependent epimerase/dehydratase family protein [Gemmatimonadota bacterium]